MPGAGVQTYVFFGLSTYCAKRSLTGQRVGPGRRHHARADRSGRSGTFLVHRCGCCTRTVPLRPSTRRLADHLALLLRHAALRCCAEQTCRLLWQVSMQFHSRRRPQATNQTASHGIQSPHRPLRQQVANHFISTERRPIATLALRLLATRQLSKPNFLIRPWVPRHHPLGGAFLSAGIRYAGLVMIGPPRPSP